MTTWLPDSIISAEKHAKDWSDDNKWKAIAIASVGASVSSLAIYHVGVKMYRKYNQYPPGPVGLPYIGALPEAIAVMMTKGPEESEKDKFLVVRRWADQYGDIFQTNFFGLNFIWITNSALLRKIMTSKKLKDITTYRWGEGTSVIFSAKDGEETFAQKNGEEWKQLRKLFLSVFNKMMTTKFMNKKSGGAIKNVLFPHINKVCIEQNKAFKIREMMKYTSFQTIFYANFDRFIDIEDEMFIKLKTELERSLDLQLTDENIDHFVYGTPLPQKYYDARDALSDIMNEIMDQRRAELREKGIDYKNPDTVNPDNYKGSQELSDLSAAVKDLEYDSYLDYLLKLVDEGVIKNSVAEIETLSLFNAGYANNAAVLEWCFVLMAKYQEIQNKIRTELYQVHDIKDEKKDDEIYDFDIGLMVKCPLLRAFIYETMRYSSFVRGGLNRLIIREDAEIEWKGKTYRLPKGGVLAYIVEYMLRYSDHENWKGDIKEFNLENFLDKNGKFKINDSFSIFGFGTRDCPGKSFAVKSIMINTAYLIMNYNIEFGEEEQRKNPQIVEIKTDPQEVLRTVSPEIPLMFSKV